MDKKMIITKKVCPCCNEETWAKKEYTKEDYQGNGVSVDEQNRIKVICDDCRLMYTWESL